ncbi:hypothetical protein M406DRAFT_358542 [Cryphonectria parasitica EP155]|uniref:Uncharacterized protein n=1 Tax=Cryphonectria parasitica (strain ATCC 38755 / EP155) TaxID=660469 RepID=A0A9P4XSP0_CRYP1|nr:uncharacterized protein M406DRAFT_358542 [Cryphonectria parasitica EP155]KAF3760208.1 hypothetical protein M406DRAFT_358542 [Cryphonectria parasitica EP155]
MPSIALLFADPSPMLARGIADIFHSCCSVPDAGQPLAEYWANFTAWLSQPHILAVVIAWAVTFTLTCTIIMCLGFGPVGIIAGSAAAAFQSFMYGGFTPAGGLFATLTSMAMVGTLMPWLAAIASVLATFVSAMVWVYGVGR